MEFKKLFEPITINRLHIDNRIVMPAMGLAYSTDYTLNDRYRNFYRARAEGGVGLMTIGPVAIDHVGSAPFMTQLYDDTNISGFQELIDELHRDTDVKIAVQLMHMGRYAFSIFTGSPSIAPSAIPSKLTRETPREMSIQDIETIQDAYVRAALRAKTAGFDLIEILACTGYLISQFLSPVTNRRTDRYGGAIENRMRFGIEVIQKVRGAVGGDLALGMRIAGNDFMEGGHTNKESALFAAAAEKAGIDAINVTGGWHETHIPQLTTNVPPGAFLYLAQGIKRKVSVPVFASNRLGDPVRAEKALRAGLCDMICWGRPLLADPELPQKVKEGRLDEITHCIACNQGCFDSIFSGTGVACVLNPTTGKEVENRIAPAEKKKTVMIAGGGPAGMECALVAAQRGHTVTLFEKSDRLGGQINLAQTPPGKAEFKNITESMSRRMSRWGVKVRLKTELTASMIAENPPDTLIVATGATPVRVKVPGIDKPHVVSAWDVLSENVWDIGKNVVIVGGSATGCETAHFVSSMGLPDADTFAFLMYHAAEETEAVSALLHASDRKVTVIEMMDRMAENVGKTARWSLMKSLRLMDVELRARTKLLEIRDREVIVENEAGKTSIPADTVIMAVGAVPVNVLAETAAPGGMTTTVIGDAKEPRKIDDAVREGFEAALNL